MTRLPDRERKAQSRRPALRGQLPALYTARPIGRPAWPESSLSIDIHWITADAALARHCAEWLALPFVALGTEFVRVDTLYPQAGLGQMCAGGQVYLVDPLAIRHWKPFAQLLEAPAVVKVLHSCSEDLEVFLRLTGS